MDRSRLAILSLALLVYAAPADGETVAIVRPVRPTADLTETLSRLHGELLSVGIQVRLIDHPADSSLGRPDSPAWLQEMALDPDVDAVIDIVGDFSPVAVNVWIAESSPRRFQISRVVLEPNAKNASERLAIRAIEVIRSRFIENEMVAKGRQVAPAPQTAAASSQTNDLGMPVASHSDAKSRHDNHSNQRLGLAGGVTALMSLDGVGPAVMPVVRVDWVSLPSIALQAALAGLGSHPTVASTAGFAKIAQQYGMLGVSYRFRPHQWLWPFVTLSAGVLRTSVEGQAELPKQGHTANQWSFLMDASLGAGMRLTDRYTLTLATHLQAAEPYVAIHVLDKVIATTGRPNLGLTLTIGAWL